MKFASHLKVQHGVRHRENQNSNVEVRLVFDSIVDKYLPTQALDTWRDKILCRFYSFLLLEIYLGSERSTCARHFKWNVRVGIPSTAAH